MYVILFLFLIFTDVVEAHVPMANYWDELAMGIVLCWGAVSSWRNPKWSKGELTGWLLLLALIVIGVLGNLVHPGLQTETVALVKDVVALSKFPVIFFLLQRRTVEQEKQEEMIRRIAKTSRWIVAVTLAAAVIGRYVDLGFYNGDVRLVETFVFVFSHPTFFISAYVMVAVALMAESIRKNRVFLLMDAFLLFLAQRFKGYIFVAFLVLFVLLGEDRIHKILTAFFGPKEKKKPFRILLALAVFGLMFWIVGKPQLMFYYNRGMEEARVALYVVGIKILMDFFPLGSGLGTFASHLSGRYYSNIYEMYGIAGVRGITQEKYNFASDVFWPYVYGQFGILGLLIYGKLILDIFLRQFRSNLTHASCAAVAAMWIYALIASTSEAYFTNGTGVQMALLLGLFIGYGNWKHGAAQTDAPADTVDTETA